MLERALEAELTAHLGYERHDTAGHNSGNSRNGAIGKKVQTGIGPVGLDVPGRNPVQNGGRPRGALPMHSPTYRASDGALASSELRVLGREYVFRDAERSDDALVMAIRFSLIPA